MSTLMEDEIKRWTARRKAALVLEISQGKTTVAKASRAHDLPPSEIEVWVEDGKKGMENALRANPQDVREQCEKQLKDLQEVSSSIAAAVSSLDGICLAVADRRLRSRPWSKR